MRLVCECLNIKVEVENFLDLDVPELDLTPIERCHPYFSKDVFKMTGKVIGITETYSHLVGRQITGSWNICQCLICKYHAHGTNYVTGMATFSSALKEEPSDLKTYGREKNICYSQVFQVCFPIRFNVPEDSLDSLPQSDIVHGDETKRITKKANSFLEMAEKKMKANTKTPVEKQLQALEALKRRVRCEEKYLHLLISQSKTDDRGDNVTKPSYLQFEPDPGSTEADRSSLLNYPETQISLGDPNGTKMEENRATGSNLVTLSLPLGASSIQKKLFGLHLSPQHGMRSKSVDFGSPHAEGIFDMDDDLAPSVGAIKNASPSSESEDTEEDDSFDFSGDLRGLHRLPSRDVARSVPLDVPAWPRERLQQHHHRGVDAKRPPKDPQDIAASMRELARSVRMTSEDVLGDLPRPKTQL